MLIIYKRVRTYGRTEERFSFQTNGISYIPIDVLMHVYSLRQKLSEQRR